MDKIDPFEVVLAVNKPSYNEEDDEDNEDEYYNTIALVVLYGLEHLINDDDDTQTHPVIFDRIPIHPEQSLQATEIAELLMAGSDVKFQDCFRMPKGAFHSLAH
ncbi:hypothetical protein ColTof4_05720 [Colletotrichum tofieldiae]|nr:hypothetical protein ColTof3_00883 [Colletotrichum tofieldiae]GKT73297.1 hypothetical protein ColTof4_05720 [Colletotrichum tofieldiae]